VAGFMELAAFCEKNVHFIEMYHCPYFTAFFSFVKVFRHLPIYFHIGCQLQHENLLDSNLASRDHVKNLKIVNA